MKKLWKRDLLLLNRYKWGIIAVYVFLAPLYYFLKMDMGFAAVIQMIFILIFFGITNLQLDTANRGYQQLFSLSITRQDYVREKFLLFGGLLISAAFCSGVSAGIINFLTRQYQSIQQLLIVELASLIVIGLAAGFFLVKAIPTGTQSFLRLTGMIFAVPVAFIILGLFLDSQGVPLNKLLNLLLRANPLLLIVIGLSLFFVEWSVLCLYTERTFAKRDIDTQGGLQNIGTMGKVRC